MATMDATEATTATAAKEKSKRGRKSIPPEMKKRHVTSYSVKIAKATAEKIQALAEVKKCTVTRLLKDELLRMSVSKGKIPFVRMMRNTQHVALSFKFLPDNMKTIHAMAETNGVTVVDVLRHACNEIVRYDKRKKATTAKTTTEKAEV